MFGIHIYIIMKTILVIIKTNLNSLVTQLHQVGNCYLILRKKLQIRIKLQTQIF